MRHRGRDSGDSLSAIEVQIPAPQEEQDQVAADEGGIDPQVPPPMIETVAQRLVKLVPDLIRAVLADVRCVVDKVAGSAVRKEGVHVLAARLARGSGEVVQLRGGADHGAVVEFGHDLYQHQSINQSLIAKGKES